MRRVFSSRAVPCWYCDTLQYRCSSLHIQTLGKAECITERTAVKVQRLTKTYKKTRFPAHGRLLYNLLLSVGSHSGPGCPAKRKVAPTSHRAEVDASFLFFESHEYRSAVERTAVQQTSSAPPCRRAKHISMHSPRKLPAVECRSVPANDRLLSCCRGSLSPRENGKETPPSHAILQGVNEELRVNELRRRVSEAGPVPGSRLQSALVFLEATAGGHR